MALSLTTAVKNEVANELFNSNTYAALGTGANQTLIDNKGATALTLLETYGQWFTFTSGTGGAPDEWMPWFIAEICWQCSHNARPERTDAYDKKRRQLMRDAMASYSPAAISVSPSSSEAFVHNTLNTRKFVLNHCARLERPFFPNPHVIDSELDAVLTRVWNKGKWAFARRPVVMRVTRTAFTGGTWTASTKTISGLTGISASLDAGTRVYITSGTGVSDAEIRDYVVGSSTSTTIVTDKDIGATDGATDIAGFYVAVTFDGMQASETFDAFASGKWFFEDDEGEGYELCWATAQDFAAHRAVNRDAARPERFRAHQTSGTVTQVLFSPPPDADYVLRGEVIVKQASDPSSTTDTGPWDKFVSEFLPTIRRAVLASVLKNHGRENPSLSAEVNDEIESLLPQYQELGDPAKDTFPSDVYRDYDHLTDNGVMGGGL
jgi:hypothetical protein